MSGKRFGNIMDCFGFRKLMRGSNGGGGVQEADGKNGQTVWRHQYGKSEPDTSGGMGHHPGQQIVEHGTSIKTNGGLKR
jgi:hypothetical protein